MEYNLNSFDPVTMIIIFVGMALLPLLLIITTSFLKVSIVLVIMRNALGVQQVPPTIAIYGISIALTVFIMAPTFNEMKNKVDFSEFQKVEGSHLLSIAERGGEPLKEFMLKHTHPDVIDSFYNTTIEIWPETMSIGNDKSNFIILLPSFVVSEIQSGFKIGFLLYLPLIVVDLIVSNILLALGMQMVSPMTISLPLKILLFVAVNGWEKLLNSLALGYI